MKKPGIFCRDVKFKNKLNKSVNVNVKVGVSVFVLPLLVGGGIALCCRRKPSDD